MKADSEKTKKELLSEISELREICNGQASPGDGLQRKILEDLQMSQLIVDQSPIILFRRDADEPHSLVYISANIRQFGYSREDFLQGRILFRNIIHPDDDKRVDEEIQSYTDRDVEEYYQLYRCITRAGEIRWVEDHTSVVRDESGKRTHAQGILRDITDQKKAEDDLKKSEEKYRRIVETAAEGFILFDEDQKIVDVNYAYCSMVGYNREELLGTSVKNLLLEDFREYLQYHREHLLTEKYRAFEGTTVARDGSRIPILIHGNTLRDDDGRVIGNMAFITNMTEQKKALTLAGEVQKSLLPQETPLIKGLDVAGRNISCDEIGGDYYDFLWQGDPGNSPFSIVVGDISGHGVDSALLMTTARAFLRMRASQPGSLAEIISAMNHHLAEDVLETGRFMTLFFLSIDTNRRLLTWVRAGHDPALLYNPQTERFEELLGTGIALGVRDEVLYEEQQRQGLADGQILAIGTDGIWEATNRSGEMFGKERFKAIIRKNSQATADEILAGVYKELEKFTAGCRREDDITLVVVRIDGLS